MLPKTAATMRQSSAVPTTAGSAMMMAGTLLEGVALTVGVTADSELVISVVSLYTSDDCDDGVSAEYADTLKQFLSITLSLGPQHTDILSPLVHLVQSL